MYKTLPAGCPSGRLDHFGLDLRLVDKFQAVQVVGREHLTFHDADAALVRAILSSLISVGALVYAAAWLGGFYDADLSAARETERFTYDFSRASWVIETVLELQQEKKGDVPHAWVEGVTRGLFDD